MSIEMLKKQFGLRTKIHFFVKKHKKLNDIYEAVDFTLKNHKKAIPIIILAVKRLFRRRVNVFILATPTHGNRGDHLIVYAMRKWCEKQLPEHRLIEFDDSILNEPFFLSLLKLAVNKRDLVLLRGGGSVGDWYLNYEYYIRQILCNLSKPRIVMFPQSVSFSHTDKGRQEKEKTTAAYDNHPNFTIYTRDETSYAYANEMLNCAKVRLCPDIALFLCKEMTIVGADRTGILFCLRPDANETYYGEETRKQIIDAVKDNHDIKFGDTSAGHRIPINRRDEEVHALLRLFAESKVAVTDRYHGVISAVITATPVIALRSADHKIVSGIKWLKDVDFVFYAENPKAVPELIEKALQCREPRIPDFSHHYDRLFEEIANG